MQEQILIDIHLQWIVIDSKVYDVTKFANLHPGGSNVLYADGVGKQQVRRFLSKPLTTALKLAGMRHKSSSVSTATKCSSSPNTRVSRLARFKVRRSSSNPQRQASSARSHTPNRHGSAAGTIAHTILTTTGSSRRRCGRSSWKSSSQSPTGARPMGRRYRRRWLIN